MMTGAEILAVRNAGFPLIRLRKLQPMNKPRSTKSEKLARAIALRDAALIVVKRAGTWENSSRPKLLFTRVGSLSIGYRTPFQRVPSHDGQMTAQAAAAGSRPPQNLPYGLDLWAPQKVFNIEWDVRGNVALVSFRPGEWEAELIAEAKREA